MDEETKGSKAENSGQPQRLTIEEIEKLSGEEFQALPEEEKRRYFDFMDRDNSPTASEFYGYEAEREQPLDWPEDGEERTADEGKGKEILDGLDRVRGMTRDVYIALVFDVWPTTAAIIDFGIESTNHYAALREAVRVDGVTPEQLDRALGNGPALTALIGTDNTYHGIVFTTSWDIMRQHATESTVPTLLIHVEEPSDKDE